MAISSARQFFEKAIREGAPFLESLVTTHTSETEWLDFKRGDDLGDEQVKSLWSKAICGFAHNQGGVLVWGIDARFDKATKVDAAFEVKHVADPSVLRSRLTQLHPGATDPPLLGVDSVAIFAAGSSGPGFVVSFVPESDAKPHRTELLDGKPYMLRIGDTFRNPSPSILRNLFFPHSAPHLQVSVACEWPEPSLHMQPSEMEMEVWYRIFLKNTSAVTARDIFVIVKALPLGLTIDCPYRTTTTDTEFGTGIEFNRNLHPFSRASIGLFRHPVGVLHRTSGWGPRVAGKVFAAYFQVFANDMLPSRQQLAFGDRAVFERREKEAMIVSEVDTEFLGDTLRNE